MKLATIVVGIVIYVCLMATMMVAQQSSGDTLSQDQARAIVQKLYHEQFGREPDAAGLEHHMRLILEEGKDAAWLATALANSEEGRKIERSKRQTRFGVIFIVLGSIGFLLLIWLLRKRDRFAWIPPALYVLWIVLLLESTIRLYFTSILHVDFFRSEEAVHSILLSKYAISSEKQDIEKLKNAEGCRVLLLGASVLDPNFGGVPDQLRSHVKDLSENQIQIFNYARASHSTRDSRFKYINLLNEDYQFDFVVIYHAINEVRANNCPEDVFRKDYSHYALYEDLNIAERHLKWAHFSVIPFVADFLYHRLRQQLTPRRYVPIGEPSPDWISHGAQLKTIPSFQENIEAVIETARSRSAQIILMTFAYYVPTSYTREAYEQKKLDYLGRGYPIELWGEPSNVIRGIEAHNQVIREIAGRNPDLILLDMERLIPKEGKYFADICHLSYEYGSEALAVPLAELLMKQCRQ